MFDLQLEARGSVFQKEVLIPPLTASSTVMSFFEYGHFISTHPTTVPSSTTIPSGLQPSHGHLGLTTRPHLFTSKFSLFLKFLYFSKALDSFSIPHCRETGIRELWHLVFSVIVLPIEFGSTVFRLLITFPNTDAVIGTDLSTYNCALELWSIVFKQMSLAC